MRKARSRCKSPLRSPSQIMSATASTSSGSNSLPVPTFAHIVRSPIKRRTHSHTYPKEPTCHAAHILGPKSDLCQVYKCDNDPRIRYTSLVLFAEGRQPVTFG